MYESAGDGIGVQLTAGDTLTHIIRCNEISKIQIRNAYNCYRLFRMLEIV